jgi:hypothetical protein
LRHLKAGFHQYLLSGIQGIGNQETPKANVHTAKIALLMMISLPTFTGSFQVNFASAFELKNEQNKEARILQLFFYHYLPYRC